MTGQSRKSAKARAIVDECRTWIGTPYRHLGRRKHVGCDCIGLVLGVWRAVFGAAPDAPSTYTPDWAEATGREVVLEAVRRQCRENPPGAIEAGDLLIFRWRPHLPAKHAGIAVASDRFVHAYDGIAVTESPLVPQWRKRVAGVFSFPDFPEPA